MRVLIIDGEQGDRAFLKRVFSRFTEDVLEAETGIDGLVALERDSPDAVVLDVGLPDMAGPQLVAAIRSSDDHGDVPIFCTASSTTREQLRRLLKLRISGLLLKPIKAEAAVEKFKPFLIAASHRQRNMDGHLAGAGAKESVILVESDPNFREFATPLLDEFFHIIGARTRAEAVQFYRNMEIKPSTIFLSDSGDQLLGEFDFFRLLREVGAEVVPRVFLLAPNGREPDPERLARLDGVLPKTFVPQTFMEAFRKIVLGETNAREAFIQMVQRELSGELVSASQQTIGVMTGEDMSLAKAVEIDPAMTVVASVGLARAGGDPVVTVDFVTGPDVVVQLAAKVLRREVSLEGGATEVVAELANTIGGRVRASLADRGNQLELQPPTVALDQSPSVEDWNVSHAFESSDGHHFVVGLRVGEFQDVESPEADPDAVEEPVAEEAALDDVLF